MNYKIDMCALELDNIQRNFERGLIDEKTRDEAIEDTLAHYANKGELA